MKSTRVKPGAASAGGFAASAGTAITKPMQNAQLVARSRGPMKSTFAPRGIVRKTIRGR